MILRQSRRSSAKNYDGIGRDSDLQQKIGASEPWWYLITPPATVVYKNAASPRAAFLFVESKKKYNLDLFRLDIINKPDHSHDTRKETTTYIL